MSHSLRARSRPCGGTPGNGPGCWHCALFGRRTSWPPRPRPSVAQQQFPAAREGPMKGSGRRTRAHQGRRAQPSARAMRRQRRFSGSRAASQRLSFTCTPRARRDSRRGSARLRRCRRKQARWYATYASGSRYGTRLTAWALGASAASRKMKDNRTADPLFSGGRFGEAAQRAGVYNRLNKRPRCALFAGITVRLRNTAYSCAHALTDRLSDYVACGRTTSVACKHGENREQRQTSPWNLEAL